jgi:hypothetical protein
VTKPRSGWPLFWHLVGITFAVVLVMASLAGIAFYVFLAIGINAWASNK